MGRERMAGHVRAHPSLLAWLIGLYAMALAVLWGAAQLARSLGVRDNPATWGFFLGIAVTSLTWAWWSLIRDASGAGIAFMGALGEIRTAEELNKLGDHWVVLSHIPFRPAGPRGPVVDIDHVAVGPYGVLVVETKRTTHAWNLSRPDKEPEIRQAADRARDNGSRVRRLLKGAAPGIPIIPLVVCWGAKLHDIPEVVARFNDDRLRDVRVVAGRQAKEWTKRLEPGQVSAHTVKAAAAALQRRIDDDENWSQKRSEVMQIAGARARTANIVAYGALTAVVLEVLLSLAAFYSAEVLQGFQAFSRLGGGFGTVVFLFFPIALAGVAFTLARWSMHISHTVDSQAHAAELYGGAAATCWILFVTWAIVTGR